jgi:hypothetical protein
VALPWIRRSQLKGPQQMPEAKPQVSPLSGVDTSPNTLEYMGFRRLLDHER